jgi:phage baseplate assembly protein W
MAILDTSITGSFNEDRDENVFIGLDLPIRKSDGVDGYFASTSTTIEAVKNNIRNLVMTNKGERYLQPSIGLNLRRYLFEQYTSDLADSIKLEISDTISYWLPFVDIKEIRVDMNDEDSIGKNKLNIFIMFNIKNKPNILQSIEVEITGD